MQESYLCTQEERGVGEVSMKSKHACVSTSVRVECSPVSELTSRSRPCKLVKVLNAGIVPVNTRRERCWWCEYEKQACACINKCSCRVLTSKRIGEKIQSLQVGQGAECRNCACEHEKREVLVMWVWIASMRVYQQVFVSSAHQQANWCRDQDNSS